MFKGKYQVKAGTGNARGKYYYYNNLEEAINKAKDLQNKRKDHAESIIIKCDETSDDAFYSYPIKNRIYY